LLTGCTAVREAIDHGKSFEAVWGLATAGAELYWKHRDAALLY
jgi:hypothetical protein